MQDIPWRVGFEVELLLPPGKSRADLARCLAEDLEARPRRCFHLQSEPSAVPGMAVFHNLTLGYVVEDRQGAWLAKCLDDLTLQADLTKSAPPSPGWYRIVSDDTRILRLIEQQSDASLSLEQVLEPIARLYGTELVSGPQGMRKVCDVAGGSVAMVCGLPGERERPCELITAPWDTEQKSRLQRMLDIAKELGCVVPVEGATHVHFEGAELRNPVTLSNLVRFLNAYGDLLKWIWGTNPRCTRLGAWPTGLDDLVNRPEFLEEPWDRVCTLLAQVDLTKYCDFNIVNLLRSDSFCTVELRVLPSGLESVPIVAAARLFALILKWARETEPPAVLERKPANSQELQAMLVMLSAEPEDFTHWLEPHRLSS